MKINIPQLNLCLDGDAKFSLMEQLLKAQVPVASSCGGDAVCAKCVLTIDKGMENISPRNDRETELARTNNFKNNQRVSCQCFLKGSISLSASYW